MHFEIYPLNLQKKRFIKSPQLYILCRHIPKTWGIDFPAFQIFDRFLGEILIYLETWILNINQYFGSKIWIGKDVSTLWLKMKLDKDALSLWVTGIVSIYIHYNY